MAHDVPEGWYADPQGAAAGVERWWNGVQWTAHTRRVDAPPPDPVRHPPPGNPDLVARIRAKPTVLPDGTPKADLSARLGAYVVDVVLVVVVAEVVSTLIGFAVLLAGELALGGRSWFLFAESLDVVVIAALWLGYQLVQRRSGQTVGKRLLHLRTRPLETDGPLDTGQAVRRAVLGCGGVLIAMFPGSQLFGVLLVGYGLYRMDGDELGRPWHDQVAGTVVVKAAR